MITSSLEFPIKLTETIILRKFSNFSNDIPNEKKQDYTFVFSSKTKLYRLSYYVNDDLSIIDLDIFDAKTKSIIESRSLSEAKLKRFFKNLKKIKR